MILPKILKKYLIILKFKIFKVSNYFFSEFFKSISYDLNLINLNNIEIFLESNKIFKKKSNKDNYSNFIIELIDRYKQGKLIELIDYKNRINQYDERISWSNNYLLSKFFFCLGIINLSIYHRNLYKNFFLNSKFSDFSFYEKIEYFKVCFENGKEIKENNQYSIFLQSFVLNFFFKKEAKSIKFIHKILIKKKFKIEVNKDSYFNLLFNKSIAIIGPANNESLDLEEVKKFDLIIQCSVFDIDKVFFSSKTISYYSKFNTQKLNDLIKKNNFNFFNKLQFISTKSYSKKISEKITNYRNFDSEINIVSGSEQLLQHIINDVISYSPKRIKLFSADFYLGTKDYNLKYSGNELRNLNYLEQTRGNLFALSFHDLFSQINHIKTYHKLGYLELDEFTSKYIDLKEVDLEEKIFYRFKDAYKVLKLYPFPKNK